MHRRKRQITRRREQQSPRRERFDRIHLLSIGLLVFSFALVYRLFDLQILNHEAYASLAEKQHDLLQELQPRRGKIFARGFRSDDLFPLATNQEMYLVYAVPRAVENPEETAQKIAAVIHLPVEEMLPRLTKPDDIYEPLKSKVNEEDKLALEALNLRGIGFIREQWRTYPMGDYVSHITGFMGYDEDTLVGRYGLEQFWDSELKGSPGRIQAKQDANGRLITVGDTVIDQADDGDDLILTIDHDLQFISCEELKKIVDSLGAEKGSVIIMDPMTGAIKAMCNYPFYDANRYNEVEDIGIYVNDAISDQWEPGSVMKAMTMSAGLDLGKVTPTTTYEDKGEVKVASFTIKNSDLKSHGTVDMKTVLVKSLNTGSIFVGQQIGNEAFYDYLKKFGFGEKTGIELAGELTGDISKLARGKDVDAYPATFGQGITVTPLQLITAYASIVNGGKLMRPYIVDTIVKENGFEVKTEPKIVRQVISEQTALTLSAMLVNVIQNVQGHAKRAQVPGYTLGGKTGTAQVPGGDGQYDPNLHKDTFLEFGPVSDPKFIVLGKVDKPHGIRFAEGSAVPLVGNIMRRILTAYEVPHDAADE